MGAFQLLLSFKSHMWSHHHPTSARGWSLHDQIQISNDFLRNIQILDICIPWYIANLEFKFWMCITCDGDSFDGFAESQDTLSKDRMHRTMHN